MRILAFITQTAVIDHILTHLRTRTAASPPGAARAPSPDLRRPIAHRARQSLWSGPRGVLQRPGRAAGEPRRERIRPRRPPTPRTNTPGAAERAPPGRSSAPREPSAPTRTILT